MYMWFLCCLYVRYEDFGGTCLGMHIFNFSVEKKRVCMPCHMPSFMVESIVLCTFKTCLVGKISYN